MDKRRLAFETGRSALIDRLWVAYHLCFPKKLDWPNGANLNHHGRRNCHFNFGIVADRHICQAGKRLSCARLYRHPALSLCRSVFLRFFHPHQCALRDVPKHGVCCVCQRVRHDRLPLAISSLVLAGVAPLLTKTLYPDYIGLFSYLLIVTLGTVWIVALRGWGLLTTVALMMIGFYSLPHIFSLVNSDTGTLLLFIYAFTAIFFITNTLAILKSKNIIPHLITAGSSGILLIAWIMTAAQEEWKSLLLVGWMIAFAIGAYGSFKITQRREPFLVYTGVCIIMLAAATSIEFMGSTLVIAYTVESGVIPLISYFIMRDPKITERLSLLLLGPMVLSIELISSPVWKVSMIHKEFFALIILAATLIGLGIFFLKRRSEEKKWSVLSTAMIIIGSVYLYITAWLSIHAIFSEPALIVIAYTIESVLIPLIVYYFIRNTRIAEPFTFALVGPMVLSAEIITSPVWSVGAFHKEFFALIILAAALIGLGVFFLKRRSEETKWPMHSTAMIIIGSVYLYITIWLSLHALLLDDRATMFSLISYTLFGLATYFIGGMKKNKAARIYGSALLGFVVLRLLLIDVWTMQLAGRITTFFVVGVLLISTAFIGRKKKTQL